MSGAYENPLLSHACWGPESTNMSCSFSTVISTGKSQRALPTVYGYPMDMVRDEEWQKTRHFVNTKIFTV